ncbi:MAG: adenylate/guanylate cyclase domain-containing protein [Vicinamibacterales bacterium]
MSRHVPDPREAGTPGPDDEAAAPPATPDAWCDRADALLRRGAPLPAYDLVSAGLMAFPGHVRLRQRLALALARAGASRQAADLLRALRDEGHGGEETLGLLARTHKDLAAAEADPAIRRAHLDAARRCYRDAFAASGGYWSAINVAAMAVLLDDEAEARAMADRVRAICAPRVADLDAATAAGRDPGGDAYWLFATLGEAALVLGDTAGALAWYARAVEAGRDRLGDRVSTRRNARLIAGHRGLDTRLIDDCFGIPRVVVCTGHLVDRPGRPEPRFPPSLEGAVREAVRRRLDAHDAGIGFASAACGADLICLECLHERGATTHVVLPYPREAFRADSVDVVPGADWSARLDRALARASDVVIASDHPTGSGGAAFEYAFRLLDGAAGVRADELDTDLVCLAVWDGRPGDGPGGTATAVGHWRAHGRTVDVIDVAALARDAAPAGVSATRPASTAGTAPPAAGATRPSIGTAPARHAGAFDPRIVALLFADVAGFSRLDDAELPRFVEHYLGLVARELGRLPAPPLLANTWGDGLYLVFDHVREAGGFALRLCRAVRETDWTALGFRVPLGVRVGLHVGPAFACQDPVTSRANFIGAHVSRAARIEPITPPGEVYASHAFAALARSGNVRDFRCQYVGPVPLAKQFGTFPTYVVRPAGG